MLILKFTVRGEGIEQQQNIQFQVIFSLSLFHYFLQLEKNEFSFRTIQIIHY